MYKVLVGNISQKRREDWFVADRNPYAVWEGKALAEEVCTGGVWAKADEWLRDRVDIDWGSVAWKANKEELTRFFAACGLEKRKLKGLDPNTQYAVVFLETVWGDSA